MLNKQMWQWLGIRTAVIFEGCYKIKKYTPKLGKPDLGVL